MKSKVVTMDTAMSKIRSGMTLMIPGFVNVGTPLGLVKAICEKGYGDFHVISNNTGTPDVPGIGKLVLEHRIRALTASHIGLNPESGKQMNSGQMKVNLVPQGTLAERIRIGGAGIGGFLTPTGVGTMVEEGKQVIEVEGKKYLLELPLRADVAILRAWKADEFGNLIYRRSARNFNPLMAMAADFVIVEADQVVPVGELDPDAIVTPGVVVDMIVQSREA
ncbi:MAG: 3-oxoacid CoA-transferase subunit A [Synergistaceae bacterium]|jgi:acetate CoA/acetoacetate CoA-transferase alpha subunit|nr:3-oxoacid CoA-transferase subunit A [Synergistaceae bacterium]